MKTTWILTAVLALVLVVGGLGFWYVQGSASPGPALRTEAVVRDDLLATISATGTLEPEDVVDVGAQVVGKIEEFGKDLDGKPIDYASVVKPRMTLAKIDDALYKARVKQSKARVRQAEQKVDQAKAKVDQAKANVQRAEADLRQAQAKFTQAERNWGRARQLGGPPTISQQDYDQAHADYEAARAAVGVAEAAVAQAKAAVPDAQAAVGDAEAAVDDAKAVLEQDEKNLEYTDITVPDSVGETGVIIARRVTKGQTVQSSFNTPSLFLIAKDLKRMKVWASVNEADIAQVHEGQKVAFTVDAYPNEAFEGVVDLIRYDATMTQNVVTYTVEVLVDNSDGRLAKPFVKSDQVSTPRGKLMPYMTANLKFEVSKRERALLVPNAALRWRPQLQQVAPDAREAFAKAQRRKEEAAAGKALPAAEKEPHNRGVVWVEDGSFVRPVKLRLGVTDGNRTEVLEGDLPEGAQVVTGEAAPGGDNGTTNPFATPVFGGGKKQQ